MPAFVVAERVRQLKQQYGNAYNPTLIANFLGDPVLQLRVRSFDRQLAQGEWLDCVGGFSNECWKQAERARFADHGIYATARAAKAILITKDRAMLETIERDGYRPGALTKEALTAELDQGSPQEAPV